MTFIDLIVSLPEGELKEKTKKHVIFLFCVLRRKPVLHYSPPHQPISLLHLLKILSHTCKSTFAKIYLLDREDPHGNNLDFQN